MKNDLQVQNMDERTSILSSKPQIYKLGVERKIPLAMRV